MPDVVVLTEDEKKWMRMFVPIVPTRGGRFGAYDPSHRTSDGRYFFGFIADVRWAGEMSVYDDDRWHCPDENGCTVPVLQGRSAYLCPVSPSSRS